MLKFYVVAKRNFARSQGRTQKKSREGGGPIMREEQILFLPPPQTQGEGAHLN